MAKPAPRTEHIQVAATLRRLRAEAAVTREEAANLLGCSISKISDLEVGRSKPKPAELERLLDRYGFSGPERTELVEFARTSRRRRPNSPYTTAVIPTDIRRAVDLHAQAVTSVFYSSELVPGMLQVRSYAQAILGWERHNRPDEAAKLLDLRMGRSVALTRTDRPPLDYWCILGEAALRSGVGGSEVMREQVTHLIEVNTRIKNVVIQVLPLGAGVHSFLGTTATWHRFPEPALDMLILDTFGRSIIRDIRSEVMRGAHHLDLVKAKALGLDESTAFLQRVHRELK
ncbi:MAG: helix-turn-helix domain-containing protein [Actinomycetota bacterium]|nr:helix-turn-helix domain-containing protein [Actinomycetota bacterium]